MSDRIITAEALITAKDATGDVFTRIAQKISGVGKSAKASVEIERMAKSLEQTQSQLRAIDKLQTTRTGFADARAKFNAQKVAVEQAARALKEAEQPTKQMQAGYQRLQAEVSRTAATFEKSKAAMLDAKHAAEGFGTPLGKIASEQVRLRSVIDSTTKAIEHQAVAENKAAAAHASAERAIEKRAHGIAHHGLGNYVLGAAAGYASAHGVITGVERTMHAGAEYQSELVALQNAGRTPDEIAAMTRASKATVLAAPTSDYIENLKVLNETTGAFGSVDHAIEHLTFMQKAASVLHATAGDKISDGPGELGNKLARFFEMRGTAGNSQLFEREAEQMMKAMVFTRGNFNPGEMLNFAQQAKSSLQNYNLDFLSKFVPSMVTEVGGERAGTQANAFNSVLLGKVNDQKQAEAWLKYGLVDPKQITMKAGHAVGWTGGAVYGTDQALQNPYAFGVDKVLPALASHGIDINDRLELTKVLGTLFRNTNANAWANELWQAQNRQRLEKNAHLTGQVEDPEAIYQRNLRTDPKVGLQAIEASMKDLMVTLSSPLMPQAASGLASLSSGIQHFANFLKDNPALANAGGLATAGVALGGAGYASYQLMNGFGLGTSAAALDGSALALDGAAAALSAAGAKQAAGGVVHAVEDALGRNGGALSGGIFKGGFTSAVMTVGSLAIAGVAAAAVIDALSSGPRKKLAADDPNFGNPFAPGSGATMPKLPFPTSPTGFPVISPGSPGAQQRPSNATGPGHWIYGRGGFRQWVADPGGDVGNAPASMKDAPFFASGLDHAADPGNVGMFGFQGQLRGTGKSRRSIMMPWGSVQAGGLIGAPMPNFGPLPAFANPDTGGPLDIRPPIQRSSSVGLPSIAPPYNPGPIDVTGKVQSDVNVKADSTVKVEITAAPGIEARQTFQSTNTKVSTGPSMPNAGRPAGIGHM